MFPSFTLVHTLHLMRHDGTLLDLRAHLGLLRFLFVSPGVLPKVAPGWRDYFRPDFHPWSRDDRELLARWAQDAAA
jgi:predicted metal-dependent hydrolase